MFMPEARPMPIRKAIVKEHMRPVRVRRKMDDREVVEG